jgi:hypothetical protein
MMKKKEHPGRMFLTILRYKFEFIDTHFYIGT